MNPIDRTIELVKSHGIVPSGAVIAVERLYQIGEVLVFGGLRYVVTKAISKQDFLRRQRKNRQLREEQERDAGFQFGTKPGQGSWLVEMNESIADRGSAELVDQGPPPGCNHYYTVKWLP